VQTWIPAFLAFDLALFGALLLGLAVFSRRRHVVRRVALVAQDVAARPVQHAGAPRSFLIAETRAKTRSGGDVLLFMRFCRHIRLAPSDPARALSIFKGAVAFALAASVLLVGPLMFQARTLPVAISAAALAGWFAPTLILRHLAKARIDEVSHGFVEALELLVVCAEAGLALEDSLARVTKELQFSQPALAEELAMTAADLQVLPDREQAFANLADRADVPAIRSVVSTLAQTLRYGTPLAKALRTAASELRSDSVLAMEEQAGRLPALMTIPLMIFILPTILLIVSGPAILRLIDLLGKG
jgi:tight adherence protein C